MVAASEFTTELEAKVAQQLKSQRVGYLLGAGSSYLNGNGYPLAFELWDLIKASITDPAKRDDIQAKLDGGAKGIEQALDLLDDGGANDTPYRHLVTAALAELFMPKTPPLDIHGEFICRIAKHAHPSVKVFSLNYDPLIEWAAAHSRVRLIDGYLGAEHSYFDAAVFEERSGRIRGTGRDKKFDPTVKPIHLLKLHGSLGWYECPTNGVRRGGFDTEPPAGTKRLMVPPQRRKAADTMFPPYSALWSAFRGCLAHNDTPINRLVCLGYGFADEHVNVVIEAALNCNRHGMAGMQILQEQISVTTPPLDLLYSADSWSLQSCACSTAAQPYIRFLFVGSSFCTPASARHGWQKGRLCRRINLPSDNPSRDCLCQGHRIKTP